MRISDEYLAELSEDFCALDDEISCVVRLLQEVRKSQEDLKTIPASERSRALLGACEKFDEIISCELLKSETAKSAVLGGTQDEQLFKKGLCA
ncbi:hypothetical protein [Nostoc sp. GT001]|uniref:hypothetical protein n=1 Tax=Nostoc sp. GT001 TaxID=3056647 RepID=UPI0025AA56D2|nr:hypothetical protein [Nostoc sp. GT001]MDM9583134.1 hypothetical protein [Nostoc sp. GT001]